jgi:hypothetical protein
MKKEILGNTKVCKLKLIHFSFMFLITCNVFPANAGVGAQAAGVEQVRSWAHGDEPERKTN